MKDITVIIPVHEYNDEIKTLLKRAINSVPKDINIIISSVIKVGEEINEDFSNNKNITVINTVDAENTNFCNLTNNAVNNVETKWFSILEFDDEYTDIWFNNVKNYIKFKPEYSVFLPLTDLTNFEDDKFLGYGNEAPWATSFSNEIGTIDNDCLQEFFDFYLTGGVFNTESWKNNGGLKPSIKLTFWYEFLLRITNNNEKVFVIPKLGYKHYLNRKNSVYDIYKSTMTSEESEWWFETAKQESLFKEDRNKIYVKE